MSIRRGVIARADHFTIIPNEWVRDARLSRRARGLLAELMSHAPGWETTIESLVETGPEGRDAIRGALGELTSLGYLVRSQERARDAQGHLGAYDYTITDPGETTSDSPTSGEPTQGEPTSADHPHKKTITPEDQKNTPPTEVGDGFEEFWKAYPRKVAKAAALKAYRRALKTSGVTPAVVMAALQATTWPKDVQFVPYPGTWINQARWMDEESPGGPADPTGGGRHAPNEPWNVVLP